MARGSTALALSPQGPRATSLISFQPQGRLRPQSTYSPFMSLVVEARDTETARKGRGVAPRMDGRNEIKNALWCIS